MLYGRINIAKVGDKLIEDLDIDFRVKRYRDEPNEAEVVIYNLSRVTREGIEEDDPIELVSGFTNSTAVIFKGAIKESGHKIKVDVKTNLRSVDKNFQTNRSYSKTFSKGTNEEFIRDIANFSGITVRSIEMDLVQNNLGRSLTGDSVDLIKLLAREGNAFVILSDDILDVKQSKGRVVAVVNAESGLLEEPEPKKEDGIQKYSVNSLFDNRIIEGERVRVQSKSGDLLLEVEEVHHESTRTKYTTSFVGELI